MACATLKRTLDWDTMNQRPSKRRRCNPFEQSTSRMILSTQHSHVKSIPVIESKVSPFIEAGVTAVSPSKMSQSIRDEIKRLHKRKQLPFSVVSLERMQDSESSGSEMSPDSPTRPETPPSRNSDKALFTFKQVQMICERMLKEREEELREKYDCVLTTKLAEQYDAFVKFTYDQIYKRYEAAPSYLS